MGEKAKDIDSGYGFVKKIQMQTRQDKKKIAILLCNNYLDD